MSFSRLFKLLMEDAVMVSFGSEFHSFGAVAENDLSKMEAGVEFQMWALIGWKCIQE